MDLVINVKKNFNPKKDDILVFNGDFWELTTKEQFLSQTKTQIRELNDKLTQLSADLDKEKHKLSTVAKIVKENLK